MVKKKIRQDQKPFLPIPIPKEIENICRVLESTELKFTTSYLNRRDTCEYCLEGVLAVNAKIPKAEIEDEVSFDDFGFSESHRKEMVGKLVEFYGFDPTKKYPKIIICPLEKCHLYVNDDTSEPYNLHTPESVMTHINDEHNKKKTHKENARLIRIFSQYYNIVTGERITC